MNAREKMPIAKPIWAYLAHLSFNMWVDWKVQWCGQAKDVINKYVPGSPVLQFEEDYWNELLPKMARAGINMVLLDLGDAVKYRSHPEIAVRGAWTPAKLRRQLDRVRALGMEPIPKLNFSTAHDLWLGPYSRCVSTDRYYAVCRDLINEVIELFDRPRFFHLGMDEETAVNQAKYEYVVIRQHDLWWRDFYFFVDLVEKAGTRAWIWSDYVWNHPDVFFKKMPKSVLQSNWYYGSDFDENSNAHVKAYLDLEEHGYNQIPAASNCSRPENLEKTVSYCRTRIAPERLLGFCMAPWYPTVKAFHKRHKEAVAQCKSQAAT